MDASRTFGLLILYYTNSVQWRGYTRVAQIARNMSLFAVRIWRVCVMCMGVKYISECDAFVWEIDFVRASGRHSCAERDVADSICRREIGILYCFCCAYEILY